MCLLLFNQNITIVIIILRMQYIRQEINVLLTTVAYFKSLSMETK